MHRPSFRPWPRPHRRTTMAGLAMTLGLLHGCIDSSAYYERPAPKAEAEAEAPSGVATAPAYGWGDAIAWRHLDEGLAEAKKAGRPLMLVVHASWCSKCKLLKPEFEKPRLTELAKSFVMVNADQDLTPAAMNYAPDGAYIPRVLFIDPATGNLDEGLQNPARAGTRYHYYYGPQDDLPAMMEKALARHGKT